MANYDATTGHTTSPHAGFLEDDEYDLACVVTCDGEPITVTASSLTRAEAKAARIYARKHGRAPYTIVAMVAK